uniref:Uncharacterized protein n=1 Tax=Pyxicephalus adspersus TaxID=30357 RepID=A0AAV3B1I6_PYXAD|nr:TPA: hypothetical protein GDO54_001819 [Pyxicephalus adspersus]
MSNTPKLAFSDGGRKRQPTFSFLYWPKFNYHSALYLFGKEIVYIAITVSVVGSFLVARKDVIYISHNAEIIFLKKSSDVA